MDRLRRQPVGIESGYGRARASYADSPGVVVAQDGFTGTTAGSNLNARVAAVGGTWATSGAATDLVFSDSPERVRRSATGTRYAILGSSTFTNVEVDATVESSGSLGGGGFAQGVIARWTDSSNYVSAAISQSTGFTGSTTSFSVTPGRRRGLDDARVHHVS